MGCHFLLQRIFPTQGLNPGFLQYRQTLYRLSQLWIHLNTLILVAQMIKNLPAMRETQVRSLGREDPLEKEMETHSSILAWKIPWMEESGRLQSMGSQRVRHDWATTSLSFTLYDETLNLHVTKTWPPTVEWDTWPSFPSCLSWHWANTEKLSFWLQTHKWSQLRVGWAYIRTAPLSQRRQLTCRIMV